MQLSPDHRYKGAERLVELDEAKASRSECPLVQLLYQEKQGLAVVDGDLFRALELYRTARQSKLLLEALLLAPDGTTERICELLSTRLDMINFYRTYFFDISVFQDKLDIVDYISELVNVHEQVTKKWALTEGFYFVASNVMGKDLHLSPAQICKRVQAIAYTMVTQASGQSITSEIAKEAKHWAGTLKIFTETLSKTSESNQSDFIADFRVVLTPCAEMKDMNEIEGDVIHG
jgi:hypothetical protein